MSKNTKIKLRYIKMFYLMEKYSWFLDSITQCHKDVNFPYFTL